MAHSPLATYLDDHLAGSTAGLDLCRALQERNRGTPLGEALGRLAGLIEADRRLLEGLAEKAGAGRSLLKEASIWVGEKVSRLKLGGDGDDLATFEALEVLGLGILGKRAMWLALAEVTPAKAEAGIDYHDLARRAEAQHAEVERYRLALAPTALGTPALSAS